MLILMTDTTMAELLAEHGPMIRAVLEDFGNRIGSDSQVHVFRSSAWLHSWDPTAGGHHVTVELSNHPTALTVSRCSTGGRRTSAVT
jgi:hypothetical protein